MAQMYHGGRERAHGCTAYEDRRGLPNVRYPEGCPPPVPEGSAVIVPGVDDVRGRSHAGA